MSTFIKRFDEIGLNSLPLVGGKNASLGELFTQLSGKGIKVPDGFAITSSAFWHFIDDNYLRDKLQLILDKLNKKDFGNLQDVGSKARQIILDGTLPADLTVEIINAYKTLCGNSYFEVAVRSSATAEDLPQASFAGQHESFLNIKGKTALLDAVKKCFASLFTDRAIKYREDNGFAHEKVALSVGVQKMVRSDKASSGVGFTLEPESGFRNLIHLAGVWGLGENIVQGTITPDEILIFKPSLLQGKKAIIQKKLGTKSKTMVYDEQHENAIINIDTSKDKKEQFVLSDDEITQLANWALAIEEHYKKPMDFEWAKDGITGEIFIIQARPETVHSLRNPLQYKRIQAD